MISSKQSFYITTSTDQFPEQQQSVYNDAETVILSRVDLVFDNNQLNMKRLHEIQSNTLQIQRGSCYLADSLSLHTR